MGGHPFLLSYPDFTTGPRVQMTLLQLPPLGTGQQDHRPTLVTCCRAPPYKDKSLSTQEYARPQAQK